MLPKLAQFSTVARLAASPEKAGPAPASARKTAGGDGYVGRSAPKEPKAPKHACPTTAKAKPKKARKSGGSAPKGKAKKAAKSKRKLASFAVQPKKQMGQQKKKGKYKRREGGRPRTPWSGTLRRVRRILRGQLTPQQALASVFNSPSMMLVSVLLEANPRELANPCFSEHFRDRMDRLHEANTAPEAYQLFERRATPRTPEGTPAPSLLIGPDPGFIVSPETGYPKGR